MTDRPEYIVNSVNRLGHSYRLRTDDYEFEHANKKSRIYVDFLVAGVTSDQARWVFYAAEGNCDELVKLMLKYMKPNLRST